MRPVYFFALTLSLLQVPGLIYAHGGGHEKAEPVIKEKAPAPQPVAVPETAVENGAPAFLDSIYSEDAETPAANGLGEYDLGESGPSPRHSDSDRRAGDVPATDHTGMDMGGGSGHEEHDMEPVELASIEWVSSSAKGRPVALGITLLVGLAFGLLTLKRPFE